MPATEVMITVSVSIRNSAAIAMCSASEPKMATATKPSMAGTEVNRTTTSDIMPIARQNTRMKYCPSWCVIGMARTRGMNEAPMPSVVMARMAPMVPHWPGTTKVRARPMPAMSTARASAASSGGTPAG